jgi:hypothetical protein
MGFAKDAVAEAERSADAGDGPECSPADLDVEAETIFMKVLDDARAVLAAAEPMVSSDDFKTRVLGGGWTFAHKGVAFDAYAGSACGVLATTFCRRRDVQLSMRFEAAAYGEAACGVLARGFCHRMQHYLNAELADPTLEGRPFGEDIHVAFVESSEFSLLVGHSTDPALLKRAAQVRALFR